MKKIKHLPITAFIGAGAAFAVFCGLLFYPDRAAQGIRNGLELLTAVVIPSLFPFAVLSSYAANGAFSHAAEKILGKPLAVLFNTDRSAAAVFLLGVTGGYPIGAKTALTMYRSGALCKDDARRLCLYCVNAGPAFAVSAVGAAMLSSVKCGMLLYCSELLSALTLGFFCRFLKNADDAGTAETPAAEIGKNAFVESVAEGSRAMINICAWVLVFSCIAALADLLPFDSFTIDFIKGSLEVTSGCAFFAGKAPLPVIAAMLGFGGVSVICQVMPYLQSLGVNKKLFVASRTANAALNAFFTSTFVRLFPQDTAVFAVSSAHGAAVKLSYGMPVCIILLILCILFILDVDYIKKVC